MLKSYIRFVKGKVRIYFDYSFFRASSVYSSIHNQGILEYTFGLHPFMACCFSIGRVNNAGGLSAIVSRHCTNLLKLH